MSRYTRSTRTSRKKLVVLFLVLLLVIVFLFRHSLFLLGIDVALRVNFSKSGFHYDTLEWKEGRAVMTNLAIKQRGYDALVDRVEIQPSLILGSLYLQQHLTVVHPQVVLRKTESSNSGKLPFVGLIPSRHLGVKLDVQNGVVQLPDAAGGQRLFFKFISGAAREKIGAFSLSYDPQLFSIPILFADLQQEDRKLVIDLKVQQLEVERIAQMTGFVSPELVRGWDNLQGEVELSARLTFDKELDFSQIAGSLNVHHFSATHSQLGVDAQIADFQGEFTYPYYSDDKGPIWKRVFANIYLRDAQLYSFNALSEGRFGLSHVDADIQFDPSTDPTIQMSGFLLADEKESEFTVEGKGSVDVDRSFWLEMGMKVDRQMEAFASFCSSEKNQYIVQVDFEKLSHEPIQMVQKALSFAYPVLNEIEISAIDLKGKITSWITNRHIKRVEFDQFIAKNMALTCKGVESTAQEAHVQGRVDEGKLTHFLTYFKRVDLSHPSFKCRDLSVDIEMKNEMLLTTRVAGIFSDIAGAITLGTEKNDNGDLELTGKFELKETPGEERALHFGVVTPHLFSGELKTGWVRSEKLSQVLYRPFVKTFLPGLSLDGQWDLFGTFDQKELALSLQGSSVWIDHPAVRANFPTIGTKDPLLLKTEGRAVFKYDFKQRLLKGMIPLSKGTMVLKDQGMQFENVGAVIAIEGSKLKVEKITASCPAAPFGSIQQIGAHLTYDGEQKVFHIGEFHANCLTTEQEPFQIGLHRFEWKQGVAQFDLYGKVKGQELFRVCGGAHQNEKGQITCSFERGKAHLMQADISSSRLVFNSQFGLDFCEIYSTLDCEHFFHHIAQCHILPSSLELPPLKGGVQIKVAYLPGQKRTTFHAESKNLKWGSHATPVFTCKGEKEGQNWIVEKLQWDEFFGKGQFVYRNHALDIQKWELSSPLMSAKVKGSYQLGTHQASLQLETFKGDLVKLLQWMHVEGALLKGSLAAQGTVNVDILKGVATAELKAGCDLFSPLNLKVRNEGVIKASFDSAQGLCVEKIQLAADDQSKTSIEEFVYDPKTSQWKVKNWQFSFSPHFLQAMIQSEVLPEYLGGALASQSFQGTMNLEKDQAGISLEGEIQDLEVAALGKNWGLKNVFLKGKQDKWALSCKTISGDQPLFLQLHIDRDEEQLLGMVKVQEHPKAPGLTLLFRKPGSGDLVYESIQGSLLGIETQFAKDGKQRLSGSLSFNPQQLSPLFSKEMRGVLKGFSLGKGYSIAGTILLGESPQFTGELKGKQCVLMGCEFQNLHADLKITPTQVHLQQFSIHDTAGSIVVKQILMQKKGERWNLSVPHVQIRELKPSVLQQRVNPDKPLKPFTIKNLTFADIRGIFGDLSSFSGKGQLSFTNAVKKESSNIFEISLDLIKDLGLDLSLLSPVSGEMNIHLAGDKFYIEELRNTYSEGQRSEFYLASGEPSYIDVKGNVHLDLKMKQDVVLKIGESFILNIRGTLDKLRYGLAPSKEG